LMTGGATGVLTGGVTGGFEPEPEPVGEVGLPVLPQPLSMMVTNRMAIAIAKSAFQVWTVKGFIVSGLMEQN